VVLRGLLLNDMFQQGAQLPQKDRAMHHILLVASRLFERSHFEKLEVGE